MRADGTPVVTIMVSGLGGGDSAGRTSSSFVRRASNRTGDYGWYGNISGDQFDVRIEEVFESADTLKYYYRYQRNATTAHSKAEAQRKLKRARAAASKHIAGARCGLSERGAGQVA